MIRLFNSDCLGAMKEMPSKVYDLAVVDPPYNIDRCSARAGRALGGSGKLKDRAIQLLSTKFDDIPLPEDYFSNLFRISKNQIVFGGNYFTLPPSRGIICWDKAQPWENFSAWEYIWTSFYFPAKIFKYDNRTGGKIHPTQKPVALYKWLLANYAKPGDKILDTHGGSMSIAIACHDLGFDLDLYEIDTGYFRAGKDRLEHYMAQSQLFQPENILFVGPAT